MSLGSVAESVDAPDLKSVESNLVGVQVPSLLYKQKKNMPHRISTSYRWLWNDKTPGKRLVLMYFIEGFSFTFDEVSEDEENDLTALNIANTNKTYSYLDLYKESGYLIMEEAHPCLFEMDIENPEILPID